MVSIRDSQRHDLTAAGGILVISALVLVAFILDGFTGVVTRLVAQLPDLAVKANFVLAPVLMGVAMPRRSVEWVRATVGSYAVATLAAAVALSQLILAGAVPRGGIPALASVLAVGVEVFWLVPWLNRRAATGQRR